MFDKSLTPEQKAKEYREFQIKFQKEVFSKMSTWEVITVLQAQISKMNPQDVNWDRVNEFIRSSGTYDYCYNVIEPQFHSLDEMVVWQEQNLMAGIDSHYYPYREIKCKDCGETFYLTSDEVDWFINKGLSIPKRCKKCRCNKKKI